MLVVNRGGRGWDEGIGALGVPSRHLGPFGTWEYIVFYVFWFEI